MSQDGLEKVSTRIPHNIEAERAVIGCLLQDNNVIDEVFATLSADMFYDFLNKAIFISIGELKNEGLSADKITAKDQAKTVVRNLMSEKTKQIRAKAKEIEGINEDSLSDEFFAEILNGAAYATNVMSYCNRIREKYVLRKAIETSSRIIEECQSGEMSADEICNIAQDDFYKLSSTNTEKNYVRADELIPKIFDKIEKALTAENGITGIKTSFNQLDSYTSGFQRTDMIILAGRPGMGKTTFSLNLAYNICGKSDQKVAYFSLEMTDEQLVNKVLADLSGVSMSNIRAGRIGQKDMDALVEAGRQLYGKNLFIVDNSYLTIAELRNRCMKIKKERGLDIVFIDYLQLMHAGTNYRNSNNTKNGFLSRQEEIAEISRNIKGLAKELNVPIIAMSQLNREVDSRKNGVPLLSDIRESGAIEQDADIVMFLSQNEKEDMQESTVLTIAKHRNGSTGQISFRFDKATSSFNEWDNNN